MKLFAKLIKKASHRALGQYTDDENYTFLRQHELFKDLTAEAFLFIMSRIVERRYSQGEIIFKQDNPGICLFIVKHGKVEVFSVISEKEESVQAIVKRGSIFGEMSIISLTARSMSARAQEHGTVLLAISAFDLSALSDRYPRDATVILKGITETICHNLVRTTHKLKKAQEEIECLKERLGEK